MNNNILLNTPEKVAKEHYLYNIKVTNDNCHPGQFINIKVNDNADPLLRRPISIFDYSKGSLSIIVQTVGRATSFLEKFSKPGAIDIIGPLGKGFSILKDKKVLLVGGGVGNAPLNYLAKILKLNNCHVTYAYGSRNKDYIYCLDEFKSNADNFLLSTDDGSEGKAGYVTNLVTDLLSNESFDMIYICGPNPMMKAMTEIAIRNKIPCEVSLENYFGCGIGVCSGCTVQTTNGQKRACVDGPVFSGEIIDWNSVH